MLAFALSHETERSGDDNEGSQQPIGKQPAYSHVCRLAIYVHSCKSCDTLVGDRSSVTPVSAGNIKGVRC